MLKKVEIKYTFKKKRDYNLITPCCNGINKKGKFVNYNELPNIYGYCHSCGKTSLPPQVYEDEKGNKYIWKETLSKYESLLNDSIAIKLSNDKKDTSNCIEKNEIKYVSEHIIREQYLVQPENNLLKYLRKTYDSKKVEVIKEMYAIGTCNEGGTVFWNINKEGKVQKSKISFYNTNGKRTNRFKVPYKNEQGYHSCLFGEHLILDKDKGKQILILVESEKTAIVGYVNMPKYTWLAYGGSNGLTENKTKALIGHKVLIIPDVSRTATDIMLKKITHLQKLGIDARVWDMTYGKSDNVLKEEGVHNMDLEDFIREMI